MIFNFYGNEALILKPYYCLNYNKTNIYISYGDFNYDKETEQFNNSKTLEKRLFGNNFFEFGFKSNKKFVLSYSFFDNADYNINRNSD